MSPPGLNLYADAHTSEALSDGRPAVLLLGGYQGYSNFGDIVQLKGAIRWHKAKTGLRTIPICEVASITDPGFCQRVQRWFGVDAVIFWSPEALDMGPAGLRVLVDSPPIRHLHVYGGGFLNRFWGEALLGLIEHLHLRFGVGHYVLSGQQVDAGTQEQLANHFRKCPVLLAGGRDAQSVDLLTRCGAPAEYSFDDAAEVLRELASALAPVKTDTPDSLDVLIHLNVSSYTHDGGGADPMDALADQLRALYEHHTRLHPDRPPRAALIQAYTDRRVHEIADTLGVAQQLEDRFPFTAYQVVELGRLALELGASPLPPLPPIARDAVAMTSSYHVTLLCALLGVPCHLQAGNPYYQQKKEGLGLPPDDLAAFLKQPRSLCVGPLFAIRASWLRRLEAVYGQPAATPPAEPAAGQAGPGEAKSWSPKSGLRELRKAIDELQKGKEWLEGQLANWQTTARQREQAIRELKEWVEQLEKGKAWLAEQLQIREQELSKLRELKEQDERTLGQLRARLDERSTLWKHVRLCIHERLARLRAGPGDGVPDQAEDLERNRRQQ